MAPGSGTFSFASSGYALQIGELADNPDKAQKKTTMDLATAGEYQLWYKDKAITIEFQLNSAATPPANGGTPPLPPAPTEWLVSCETDEYKLYPTFRASRKLTPDELFATRCFLSYWWPQAPPQGSWQSRELDGDFGMISVGGTSPLERRFRWSSASDTLPGLAEMPSRTSIPLSRTVSGELVSTIEKDARRLAGKRTLQSFLAEKLVAENNLDIEIYYEPTSLARTPEPAQTEEYDLAPTSDVVRNEKELQQKFLKGADLVSILANIPQTPLETKKRNERFLQLRALFYLKPEQAMKAVKSPLQHEQRMLVAEALVGAGNVSSIDAFAVMLDQLRTRPEFEPMVALVVPATNLATNLEKVVVDAAFDTPYTKQSYTLQLIVGSNIRRCLKANPAQAARLSQHLVDAIRATTNSDDQVNLLYAFGNAGNIDNLPTQAQFLGSSKPAVRAAAAHSYRHFPAPVLSKMLDQLSANETDPLVLNEISELKNIILEKKK